MDEFATEEQQVEAIKRFFKENGIALVAGAVIGLGGLYGWRAYSDFQIKSKDEASASYQTAVEATVSDESLDQLATFEKSTSESGYKAISALVLAKEYVDADNLDAASSALEDVIASEANSPISAVASLRLAAIYIQQGDFDGAISTIDTIKQDSFQGKALELKGDALVALTKIEEAKEAYTAALATSSDTAQVQMKLDNLALIAGA